MRAALRLKSWWKSHVLDARLPPIPDTYHTANDMWVDEQIWGHRLWDGQDPWLTFLEFLTVAEACHRDGRLLDVDAPAFPLNFQPPTRMYLRNILYNNDRMFEIAQRFPDSDRAWEAWLELMERHARGVHDHDFRYLKDRFESFQQFCDLVAMLRGSTIESSTSKGWTSRFVFPFGPNAIYEDVTIAPNGGVSRPYVNFGRTGELLYLMLLRSDRPDALRPHLAAMFERPDPCNRLLGWLQPDRPDERHTRGQSYLPYERHPAFDALAEDWMGIFQQGLPRFDAYPHLANLAALHLCLYQLQTAAAYAGMPQPTFVCEVVAPRKTLIRELSFDSYIKNDQLPQLAVEAFVREIASSAEWQAAAASPSGFTPCRQLLRTAARWPQDDDYEGPAEPAALLSALKAAALSRHRKHVANIHRAYGGGAGLVSKRGTTRPRYAPTDDLLKALILANVPVRMEFGAFLDRLYQRYGIVLGEREARQALPADDFDKRAFQANADRLEVRLRTLGMLRRLSDACAYVENPMQKAQRT